MRHTRKLHEQIAGFVITIPRSHQITRSRHCKYIEEFFFRSLLSAKLGGKHPTTTITRTTTTTKKEFKLARWKPLNDQKKKVQLIQSIWWIAD